MRSNSSKRGLVTGIAAALCVIVLLVGVLVVYAYYAKGKQYSPVSMKQYAKVDMDDNGQYVLSVDADGIIADYYLPNPKTTSIDITKYPDVEAVYSLSFVVSKNGDSYTVQTASDKENASAALKKGGITLTNTEWTWTADEMKAAYQQSLEYPRKLSIKKYVLCTRGSDGSYVLKVDQEKLLKACGWTLPDDEEQKKAHTGYQAVMSLGFYVTEAEGAYRIETTSTLDGIVELLSQNGVQLTDTTWQWTLIEVEALYTEQNGALPAETPETSLSPEASTSPEASATPGAAPTTAVTPTPALSPTAVATATAAAAASPVGEKGDALSTLYQFDQTALRKAIRSAKENYYGSKLKESTVSYNYFFVGKSASAEYGNCFRLVYTIKTTSGTEYLVADVYNIGAKSSISASDVKLTSTTSSITAKSTSDFASSLYTTYTLNGGSMVYSQDGGTSPFDSNGFVFPDSLETKITASDIWSLPTTNDRTLFQVLGYARNEIFARCGHKFKDTSAYTKFYSSYGWYQPTGSISYNDIKTKFPTACTNIDFIKDYENLIKVG